MRKFSSHLEAVKAYKSKPDSSNKATDSSNRTISPIYNNINNNKESYPQPKTWDGLAETAKNPSIYLKEFMEKQI